MLTAKVGLLIFWSYTALVVFFAMGSVSRFSRVCLRDFFPGMKKNSIDLLAGIIMFLFGATYLLLLDMVFTMFVK